MFQLWAILLKWSQKQYIQQAELVSYFASLIRRRHKFRVIDDTPDDHRINSSSTLLLSSIEKHTCVPIPRLSPTAYSIQTRINGSWSCIKCKMDNYPIRLECAKCGETRDSKADKAVSDFALMVYQQCLKKSRKMQHLSPKQSSDYQPQKQFILQTGLNGNWICANCNFVNYPRRLRCKNCNEIRDSEADKIVSDYASVVYQQLVKTYKKLQYNLPKWQFSDKPQQYQTSYKETVNSLDVAPVLFVNPEEFKNPSCFLKVYGDLLCRGGEGSDAKINGFEFDGDWSCLKCNCINHPKLDFCNQCGKIRGREADKIVSEYASAVYQQHIKEYNKLYLFKSPSPLQQQQRFRIPFQQSIHLMNASDNNYSNTGGSNNGFGVSGSMAKSPKAFAGKIVHVNGVGGKNFSAPSTLVHPKEFKNPSCFLKVYGDPLCRIGVTKPDLDTIWQCVECNFVNYPRKLHCVKCKGIRHA